MTVTQDIDNLDELSDFIFYKKLNDQYDIQIWDNNAGVDRTGDVTSLDVQTVKKMIETKVSAVAILSTLFAHDHENDNAQLINII